MKRASRDLEFEIAAELRDEISRMKRLLPDANAPVALASTRKVPARSGGRGRR
jgi:excinuclease UvrABC nuclease subunit